MNKTYDQIRIANLMADLDAAAGVEPSTPTPDGWEWTREQERSGRSPCWILTDPDGHEAGAVDLAPTSRISAEYAWALAGRGAQVHHSDSVRGALEELAAEAVEVARG